MKICYFGTYSIQEGYPRNNVIIKGLRKNGVEVIECHVELWKGSADKLQGIKTIHYNFKLISKVIHTYLLLILKFFKIPDYDVLIVGFAGHFDIFLAKFLNIFRKKLIVFDAVVSIYDTLVNERKVVKQGSFKARLLWLIDKYACCLADVILLEAYAHIDYFVEEFGLSEKKFIRVPIGADDEVFQPIVSARENNRFTVIYSGSYLPLHGLEFVVRAAKLLEKEDIHFILVGSGLAYTEIKNLADSLDVKNIEFINQWLGYDRLKEIMVEADACLGIFGITVRAPRVVCCKAFLPLAMAKPLITGDSQAAREILVDKQTALLCTMGDAQAIKESILLLRDNRKLREDLAINGYQLFINNFSPQKIGERLLIILDKTIKRGRR